MYRRAAQDKIRQYHADATCNGLEFDRHQEECDVDALSAVIETAGHKFLLDPVRAQLPDWLRTIAAVPNIREKLREAAINGDKR
jgi:glucosyl-3-phosphoglycerate synthase